MGAVRVVSSQDLADEQEEIIYATRAESGFDGRRPVAFAKLLVADMGMRHIVVPFRAMRVHSDDFIRLSAAYLFPAQDDPKRAQIDVFEHDRGREYRGRTQFEIQIDSFEFFFQGNQLRKNLTGGCHQVGSPTWR